MVDGPAVSLRDVVETDLQIFFEQQLADEATAMAAFPPRDAVAHEVHWTKILADETVGAKTIVADEEVAGNVVSWMQDGHREIGYWIGIDHWGRGIATKALTQFVQVEKHRPLYAWVAEHNRGSIRVLQKCGFTLAAEQPEPQAGDVRYAVFELSG